MLTYVWILSYCIQIWRLKFFLLNSYSRQRKCENIKKIYTLFIRWIICHQHKCKCLYKGYSINNCKYFLPVYQKIRPRAWNFLKNSFNSLFWYFLMGVGEGAITQNVKNYIFTFPFVWKFKKVLIWSYWI